MPTLQKTDSDARLRWLGVYCGICERLREILLQAPWSSFDLIAASVAFWVGVYLTSLPVLFDPYPTALWEMYPKLYPITARLGSAQSVGAMFALSGFAGILNSLWISRPPFLVRLFARMIVAFCLSAMALDMLGNPYPPIATPTHCVLAIAALWSVWRTPSSGR